MDLKWRNLPAIQILRILILVSNNNNLKNLKIYFILDMWNCNFYIWN